MILNYAEILNIDLTAKNNDGYTGFKLAKRYKNNDIMELIKRKMPIASKLENIIRKVNELSDHVKEVDPNPERHSKFLSGIEDLMKSYKDELKKLSAKKRKETSVGDDFFNKRQKQ